MSLRPSRGSAHHQAAAAAAAGGTYHGSTIPPPPPPPPPPAGGAYTGTTPRRTLSGYGSSGGYAPPPPLGPLYTHSAPSPASGGGLNGKSAGTINGKNGSPGTTYGGYAGHTSSSYYGSYAGGYSSNQGYTGGGAGYTGSASTYSGYTSSSPPQQSEVKNIQQRRGVKRKDGKRCSFFGKLWFWTSITSICLGALSYHYQTQLKQIYTRLDVDSFEKVSQKLSDLTASEKRATGTYRSMKDTLRIANEQKVALDRENRELQSQLTELRTKYESPEAVEEQQRRDARELAWFKHVEVLQTRTRRNSHRAVAEKYGEGPHQVEFAIVLPGDNARFFFVVELAPLAVMPHAVHIFLEQVSHGLWNKAWFYINGPHVMQAGPRLDFSGTGENDEDPRLVALRPFQELALDSLAFPEYSEEFPHVAWTLGFTGRPSGPDFYINKVDNRETHGPGGQNQHELGEFADPCFAKVIKGFDTLERIASVETVLAGDYQYFFEFPVEIVEAIILQNPIRGDDVEISQKSAGFGHVALKGRTDERSEAETQQMKRLGYAKIEHRVDP